MVYACRMTEQRFRLYDAAALAPVVARMARQLVDRLDARPALLVGILRRGAPLADRLKAAMAELPGAPEVTRLDLQVKRYGDDLSLLCPQTSLTESPEQATLQLAGSNVVLVDDVLYQGHSLARVLEWARSRGAGSVHSVVLVDRLARQLPVYADVVGLTLQIAPADVIECNVPPFEREFGIDLLRLGGGPAPAG
jgi:pyrimidine operon attenuation protein / uracil phosphoribosyltransferase